MEGLLPPQNRPEQKCRDPPFRFGSLQGPRISFRRYEPAIRVQRSVCPSAGSSVGFLRATGPQGHRATAYANPKPEQVSERADKPDAAYFDFLPPCRARLQSGGDLGPEQASYDPCKIGPCLPVCRYADTARPGGAGPSLGGGACRPRGRSRGTGAAVGSRSQLLVRSDRNAKGRAAGESCQGGDLRGVIGYDLRVRCGRPKRVRKRLWVRFLGIL